MHTLTATVAVQALRPRFAISYTLDGRTLDGFHYTLKAADSEQGIENRIQSMRKVVTRELGIDPADLSVQIDTPFEELRAELRKVLSGENRNPVSEFFCGGDPGAKRFITQSWQGAATDEGRIHLAVDVIAQAQECGFDFTLDQVADYLNSQAVIH